jgi:hypothetical protein
MCSLVSRVVCLLQELWPERAGVRHIDAAVVHDEPIHDRPGGTGGPILSFLALR